jgi:hypothetical protein
MLRILFFIALSVFSFACLAQENDSMFIIKEIPKNEMEKFLDSLRDTIAKDTSRFKRSDLIYSSIGALNKNPYSPLFIVNKKYKYKLDIVSGQKVMEFIDEFLNTDKIESIIFFNSKAGIAVYGDLGKSGVLLITIKKAAKVNYHVSGFQMYKDQSLGGNNFKQ